MTDVTKMRTTPSSMARLIFLCQILVLLGWVHHARAADPYPRDWFWGDDAQRREQDKLVGRPAPRLQLSHWFNGTRTPYHLKDKIVVVDFWATWCGPCIRSIPHNNELLDKYSDQGVEVIGVCGSDNGQEKMLDVARSKGIRYPIARDTTLRSAEAWRVMWWPTYGVIDRKGVLRALGLKPQHVEQVVQQLLTEQPASAKHRTRGTGSGTRTGGPFVVGGGAGSGSRSGGRSGGGTGGETVNRGQSSTSLGRPAPIPAAWLEGDARKRGRLTLLHGANTAPQITAQNWLNSKPI